MTSEGTCHFCGKTFTKAGITRHLNKHLQEMEDIGKQLGSFHLKVESNPRWGKSPYFLNLWVDSDVKLKVIDKYLRGIWLECCGHLSAFRTSRRSDEVSMNKKAVDVFTVYPVLEYEYDFGSTTDLLLTVVGVSSSKPEEKIVLLSRNEPLPIMCDRCNKQPATQVCTVCSYEDEGSFCDKCAKQHATTCEDFDDYAAMPVVNSPRMGVCGYEGGTIDKERDGIYIAK